VAHGQIESRGEAHGERCGILGRSGTLTRQGERKTDDDLEGIEFGRDRGDSGDVAVSPRDRLDRCREHAVEVAPGDTDTNRADVDAEAHS